MSVSASTAVRSLYFRAWSDRVTSADHCPSPAFLKQVYNLLDDDGIFVFQVAGIRPSWQFEDLIWGLFMNKYAVDGLFSRRVCRLTSPSTSAPFPPSLSSFPPLGTSSLEPTPRSPSTGSSVSSRRLASRSSSVTFCEFACCVACEGPNGRR